MALNEPPDTRYWLIVLAAYAAVAVIGLAVFCIETERIGERPMNWFRRVYNHWRYRPTLQDFWKPSPGDGKIVSTTQFRDMIIVATEYGVYVVTPGHRPLWDWEIQKIAVHGNT